MASIGILGGTFNPPHRGHLALARQARDELGLGRVLLMPAAAPPHKPSGADPGAEHRLAMCRLAVAGEERIEASGLELERPGPSYTVDTLRALHAREPDAQLTFIVGADTALTLPTWHEPQEVLRLAGLAVAARSGADEEAVLAAVREAAGAAGEPRVRILAMEPIEASSSAARERLGQGHDAQRMLTPAVAAYIAEHGLYRAGGQG